ncbi:MAG TPA: hypothetical protein VFK30_00660, partial [Anaerolineae bacterium]|nr:hypothetical protein [Anaerolineae bacterium]
MTRNVLPNRRAAETFDFEHQGMHFTVTVGRLEYESPVVEIFLNNEYLNSLADSTARDAAIAISIGLQYGVPLETLRK